MLTEPAVTIAQVNAERDLLAQRLATLQVKYDAAERRLARVNEAVSALSPEALAALRLPLTASHWFIRDSTGRAAILVDASVFDDAIYDNEISTLIAALVNAAMLPATMLTAAEHAAMTEYLKNAG